MLALLAYGVNLRSRAGASAADLRATVTTALETLCAPIIPARRCRSMAEFTVYDEVAAPEAARPQLAAAKRRMGSSPPSMG